MNKQKWYVVRNGEILYTGTWGQCVRYAEMKDDGALELYPAEARVIIS